MNPKRIVALLISLVAVVALAACGGSSSSSSSSASSAAGGDSSASGGSGGGATLNGSGSSLQAAFEQAAAEQIKSSAGITVNYGGGGSGKGRTDLASQVVDFAGSDSPIKDEEKSTFKGGDVLYFPILVEPVTVAYNLDGVKDLKLDAPTIAKIFQRQITKWNDPAIAAQNSGATLPDQDIVVARRSDSSGTTDNFSKFLDKAATGVWTLGTGSTITFPADTQGGNGNSGVAQIVQQTKGAVGYVDLSDAVAGNLAVAQVKNQAGSYIAPSVESGSAAAAAAEVKPDLTFSPIWSSAADGYPITAQSYVLVYKNQTDKAKGEAIKKYLAYLLGDGQALLPDLSYGKLPQAIADKAKAQIDQIVLPA